jgi:hypothetical protein
MVDKSMISVNLNTFVAESRIQPNLEWKFVSLTNTPSWSVYAPGTQDSKQMISTDWSVTKFTISI